MHVVAVPASLAVAAGAALSCSSRVRRRRGRGGLLIGGAYVLAAAAILVPLDRAHYFYEKAVASQDPKESRNHLRTASKLDPDFPLYRARAAWLEAQQPLGGGRAADEAHRAAQEALSVAPLWLAAGAMGVDAGRPWAAEALKQARRLDPLSPLVAFQLLRAMPGASNAVELGLSAVRGDERFGAAVFWLENPELREAVRGRLGTSSPASAVMDRAREGNVTALLGLSMDTDPAVSFSLFAFRRSPWPADLAPVEVAVPAQSVR